MPADLVAYVPLGHMTLAVLGAVVALVAIEPPPAPKPGPRPLVMIASQRRGLTTFGRTPVTTPPGDPHQFYSGPGPGRPPVPAGRRDLHTIGTWPSPPPPVFARQSPTLTTGELDALGHRLTYA